MEGVRGRCGRGLWMVLEGRNECTRVTRGVREGIGGQFTLRQEDSELGRRQMGGWLFRDWE